MVKHPAWNVERAALVGQEPLLPIECATGFDPLLVVYVAGEWRVVSHR